MTVPLNRERGLFQFFTQRGGAYERGGLNREGEGLIELRALPSSYLSAYMELTDFVDPVHRF